MTAGRPRFAALAAALLLLAPPIGPYDIALHPTAAAPGARGSARLVWAASPFGVAVTPNAVDAYIHYLRDKLGGAGRYIQTVRGVGYRLADA